MPTGHYGTVDIAGRKYQVVFWSSLKSDCQKQARWYRKNAYLARVIRHSIRHGALAGGVANEEWAVAISPEYIHRKLEMKKPKHGRK